MREAARREGRAKLYDGRWRDRDPAEAPPGVKPVIRLKAPQTGETVIEDQVQGRVVWQNSDLDDLVLLRSDGTPTYMLAVVVDDHDMAVTHIIRGDDHLTNGARQKHIYEALGWNVPIMAHIPLIHGPDGSKLSKRHGALGVDAYRAMGYLPAAMRNYLVRLGWAHGDQEIFTTEEMIAAFDLPQIGRSPARFDFTKLESLNGHYIRATADADLIAALEQLLAAHCRRSGAGQQDDAGLARQTHHRHAGPEGTRQDFSRIVRRLAFLVGEPSARAQRPSQGFAHARGARSDRHAIAGAGGCVRVDRRGHRSGRARLCRARKPQARPGGAAAARRADRAGYIAADI